MMPAATDHYDQPLTAERLSRGTHPSFPTGLSGMARIGIGAWRDDCTGERRYIDVVPEARDGGIRAATVAAWGSTLT
jgi:hypothetical protein